MSVNFINNGGNYPVLNGDKIFFEKPGLMKKFKCWKNNNLQQVNKKLAGVKEKVFVEKDIKTKIDLLEKKWKPGFVSKAVLTIVNFIRGLFCLGSLEPKYKTKLNEKFAESVQEEKNKFDYNGLLNFVNLNKSVIDNVGPDEKDLVKFFVSQKNENDKKDNKAKPMFSKLKKMFKSKEKEIKEIVTE